MSGIKWQKAKAIWSKKGASLGWKADTWPKRMAPWQLAVLQYPSEVSSSDATSCKKAIEAAIKSGQVMHVVRRFELPRYVMYLAGTKPPVEFQDLPAIAVNDFSQWLQSEGEAPSIHIQAWIDAIVPAETKPQAAPIQPAEREPAPVVEVPVSTLLPVTTSDIAYAFDGLRGWNEKQWKKPLGDKPKWLAACVLIPAVRGVSETRWNPVLIGAALVKGGHAKANSVRSRFQTMSQLKPWFEEWKTYEADHFDTA